MSISGHLQISQVELHANICVFGFLSRAKSQVYYGPCRVRVNRALIGSGSRCSLEPSQTSPVYIPIHNSTFLRIVIALLNEIYCPILDLKCQLADG